MCALFSKFYFCFRSRVYFLCRYFFFLIKIVVRFFSLVFWQVEDAVSRAADGTSVGQELDFSSLHSQLGPLAAVSEYFHFHLFNLFRDFTCFWMRIVLYNADMFYFLPDSVVH